MPCFVNTQRTLFAASTRLLSALLAALALASCSSNRLPVHVEHRMLINDLPQAAAEHTLSLSIADIAGWETQEIITAVREAALTFGQCRIHISKAELLRIVVPDAYRYFDTPRSRMLARALPLPKPVLYFAAGTRQVPAFDAEAIGRGNSRTRPELTDTVWIARGARDLGIVIAHELAHVLMDSGEHDNSPGNLMAETTAAGQTRLTAEQCARMRETGTRNGLLRPGVN